MRIRRHLTTLVISLAVAAIAASCSSGSDDGEASDNADGSREFIAQDETGAFIEPGNLFGKDLRVGDCMSNARNNSGDSVSIVPCSGPYEGRVFDQLDLEAEFGEDAPEQTVMTEFVERSCIASESAEVGQIRYFLPNISGWVQGNRSASCIVVAKTLPRDESGKITEFDDSSPDGTTSSLGNIDASRLQTGDCFADRSSGDQVAQDCDGPHAREVFHRFTLTGDSFPGDAEVNLQAQEGCVGNFALPAGVPVEEADLQWFLPTEEIWDITKGGKDVICHAASPDDSAGQPPAEPAS